VAVVAMAPALYRAALGGQRSDDLSAYVASGRVEHNVDAAVKTTFRADLLAPGGVADWDVLAPVLTLTHDDGTVVSEPVGLFVVPPSPMRHGAQGTTGRIDARDLTWILQNATLPDGYAVAAGAGYAAALRAVATEAGFAADRVTIPDSGATLPAAASWPPGTTRYQVMVDLARGCAYYAPYMDRHGLIVSRPMLELDRTTPARTYSSTDDAAELVGEIDDEPDLTRLCNRVTVRRLDPGPPALYASRTNADPDSPSSTVALGDRLGLPELVLARTIDEPTVADQAAADALAAAYLSQGSSYYRKLTLRTTPDPTAGMHDVLTLDIANPDGTVATDRWWRTGWSLGFSPRDGQGVMEHRLARVESYRG
jgi:hypothetical protein